MRRNRGMTNVEHLFDGDMRCETLLQAVKALIYERGVGIPVPTIIGILEILKLDLRDEIIKAEAI